VVRGDPAGEPVEELVVAEHLEVLVGDARAAFLDEGEDLVALLGRGQAQVGVQALLHRGVAADPAEDEHDRGQQPGPVEPVDHVDPARSHTRGRCRARSRLRGRLPPALARGPASGCGPVVARHRTSSSLTGAPPSRSRPRVDVGDANRSSSRLPTITCW
jgi:hypothetical protein